MFGLCAPTPKYAGEGQPQVTGTSPLGLLELVFGFLRNPTPVYSGQQPASPPSLFCSLFGAPTPAYVMSDEVIGPGQTSDNPNPSAPRTGGVKST
jgi:hypothetical protein